VGTNGTIKGTIVTDKLTVQGYIEGNIDAQTVIIKSSGHIRGEISSVELMIESKGVFEGNSVMKETPKALEKKS
jgi:cytoskeletal protein CcmA (bactofilin family)